MGETEDGGASGTECVSLSFVSLRWQRTKHNGLLCWPGGLAPLAEQKCEQWERWQRSDRATSGKSRRESGRDTGDIMTTLL